MSALERVQASRERLRLAMAPPRALTNPPSGASWRAKLKNFPAVDLVIDTLREWWARHPLRPLTRMAAEASTAVVRPLARRNPFAMVLVAGAVGAALMWRRPWRWVFSSALFAGLVPQLASRVVARLPVESWMNLIGSALSSPSGRGPTRSSPAS